MSNAVKIALYVTLVILASLSGYFAMKGFGRLMNRGERTSELERVDRVTPKEQPEQQNADLQAASATAETNEQPDSAADASTNEVPITNTVAGETNTEPEGSIPPETASAESSDPVTAVSPAPAEVPTALGRASREGEGKSRLGLAFGIFILSMIGLGLLIASDASHFMGNRALEVIYNDDGEGIKNPEYEAAEEVWTNGDHLEAIRMMREYLNTHPREQFVALRIAEIYEKDLGNFLAAALEYEEVLKHKLPPERWGWAAIHLCNLYFKLDKEDKAHALLRRIVKEYGNTAAADKARKRLEKVDSEKYQLPTKDEVETPSAPPPSPASNLPPGFRPKK